MLTSTYEARPVRASAFLGHVAHLWPTVGPSAARMIQPWLPNDRRSLGPQVFDLADNPWPGLVADAIGVIARRGL